jgi:hypothetical protein
MSEEQGQAAGTAVDQGGLAGDYFSQYQLSDDDGNPIAEGDDDAGKDSGKPKAGEKKQEQQGGEKAPAGKEKEGEEGREQKAPKPIDKGFLSRFFKPGEGEGAPVAFDSDGAINYFTDPKADWKYAGRKLLQEKPQQQETTPDGKPREEAPPWKARMDADMQWRKDLTTNLSIFPEAYLKARQAGQDETTAYRMAQEAVSQVVNEQFERRRYQFDFERGEKDRLDEADRRTWEALAARARANQEQFAGKFGDSKDVGEFLYGETGGQIINALYDLMNPDKREGTSREMQDRMNRWWTKSIASDMAGLNFVRQLIRGQQALQMLPHFLQSVRGMGAREVEERERAAHRKPSKIRAGKQSMSKSEEALAEYLGEDTIPATVDEV